MTGGPTLPSAYPRELALLVRQRWNERADENNDAELPPPSALEELLSTCYQASLLREEGRPVTFRIVLAEPEHFAASGGAPEGFHRLVLSQFRPFDRHELRRLAPAAGFQRSLIGVRVESDGSFRVWGLVHSGTRWLEAVRGGRRSPQSIRPLLMVSVTGPGRVLVSRGTGTIAALAGGTLAEDATDVFAASWLASFFAELYAEQRRAAMSEPAPGSSPIEPVFGEKLVEQVLRRIVATIRGERHGGTLIILPERDARRITADGRYLKLKYPFRDEEPRRRIFSLTVQIMKHLANVALPSGRAAAGWTEYESSGDAGLAALDEALFEVAHLVAMLADVDGAVVMTDRLEILGFGAEISGALPEVATVERSLDLEGSQSVPERTDGVGTRHRSAYRLSQKLEAALVVVVSQDGGVRFVRWHDERVLCFDQVATGPWEV